MQLAKTKNFQIPTAATSTRRPLILTSQKPKEMTLTVCIFNNMVSGHRQTVKMFQNYATTGKDPDVKAFCSTDASHFKRTP